MEIPTPRYFKKRRRATRRWRGVAFILELLENLLVGELTARFVTRHGTTGAVASASKGRREALLSAWK